MNQEEEVEVYLEEEVTSDASANPKDYRTATERAVAAGNKQATVPATNSYSDASNKIKENAPPSPTLLSPKPSPSSVVPVDRTTFFNPQFPQQQAQQDSQHQEQQQRYPPFDPTLSQRPAVGTISAADWTSPVESSTALTPRRRGSINATTAKDAVPQAPWSSSPSSPSQTPREKKESDNSGVSEDSGAPDSLYDVSQTLAEHERLAAEAFLAAKKEKKNEQATKSKPGTESRSGDEPSSESKSHSSRSVKKSGETTKKTNPSKEDDVNVGYVPVTSILEDEFEDEPENMDNKADPPARGTTSVVSVVSTGRHNEESHSYPEKEKVTPTKLRQQRPRKRREPDTNGDYDEEQAVYPQGRRKENDNKISYRQLMGIFICLGLVIIAASFAAAYAAVRLAKAGDDNKTHQGPDVTTSAPAPSPNPIFYANNTIGCPNENVPLELIIIFDSKPAEIGIFLRDSTRSLIWQFGAGTFKSFSQLLRENYFMVCIAPQQTYELEISDLGSDGLVSNLLNQSVYGKFSIFYQNRVVSTYDGDCTSTEVSNCGSFCACKFVLQSEEFSGQCQTECDMFAA